MTIKKTITYGVILLLLVLVDWIIVNPGIGSVGDTVYGYDDFREAVDLFTWYLLKYSLYSIFYIILLFEFRRDSQFVWYSIIAIISYIGFAGYFFFSTYFDWTSLHFRVTAGIATFGPSFLFLLASTIVLRDGYIRWITRPLLLFSIVHIVYDSFVSFFILNYFITLYGPFKEDILKMMFVYNGLHYTLQLVVLGFQIIVIYHVLFFKQVVELKKQKESEHRITEFNAIS